MTTFDTTNPPDPELLADCVHCGFCLPACPTYVLFGEEMDSPRGRIDLMAQAVRGEPLSDAMASHFDLCLGCMACVPACPSGVRYDVLIEATRGQVERNHPRSRTERALRSLIFRVFPYPQRLRLAGAPLRAYQRTGMQARVRRSRVLDRLPKQLRAMERLLPDAPARAPLAERTPATGPRRRTVGLVTGCVQRAFFPGVNAATARVLAAEHCEVIAPPGQGCCGALSMHAGREEEARGFARRLIATFERAGVDQICINAAGCGSAMKSYDRLLADDPLWARRAARFVARVRDITEVLTELEPMAERRPLPLVVAYQDACHLAHAQGISAQPRDLLRAIPSLELRELDEPGLCCGSAGIYNLVQPDTAMALGDRKAASVTRAGADLVVTANPGCMLQLRTSLERAGQSMPIAHLVEVLDASIAGEQPWLASRKAAV